MRNFCHHLGIILNSHNGLPVFSTYASCTAWCVKWTTLHRFPTKEPIVSCCTEEEPVKIMEPGECILVTYWNWMRGARVSTYQGYNQSWLQTQESRHSLRHSLQILLLHTTHGICAPDPYRYWYSHWWQVSRRSVFKMPHQHCQLSHRAWCHRLLCIWNPPWRGKSAIGPPRCECMVKAVGCIGLVSELLIWGYMTGLAQVQVQYSEFVIRFLEGRYCAQWHRLLFTQNCPDSVHCSHFLQETSGL